MKSDRRSDAIEVFISCSLLAASIYLYSQTRSLHTVKSRRRRVYKIIDAEAEENKKRMRRDGVDLMEEGEEVRDERREMKELEVDVINTQTIESPCKQEHTWRLDVGCVALVTINDL